MKALSVRFHSILLSLFLYISVSFRTLPNSRFCIFPEKQSSLKSQLESFAIADTQSPNLFKNARALHWVFKISSLRNSLDFFERCFNMKILRHEEFVVGCSATCNGDYAGPWSKTMIGRGSEESSFTLELTYNYGVNNYIRGNDLRYLAVRRSQFCGSVDLIEFDNLGRQYIECPDGYWIYLVECDDLVKNTLDEIFLFTSIHVSNLKESLNFYCDVLGATQVLDVAQSFEIANQPSAMVSFDNKFGIQLVELESVVGQVDRGTAFGRLAVEVLPGVPEQISKRVREASYGSILHGPQRLEPHGEEVVIAQDPDGHEYCFVDCISFKACTNVSTDEVSFFSFLS